LAAEAYDWQQKELMPTSVSHISSVKAKDMALKAYLRKLKTQNLPNKRDLQYVKLHDTDGTTGEIENWRTLNLDNLHVDVMDTAHADEIEVKIADLGLACWEENHENDGIQARPVKIHKKFPYQLTIF